MNLTVNAYLRGIPPGNRNVEKPLLLRNFIEGVNACGDFGQVIEDTVPQTSDVAVIQGFVHHNSRNSSHLMLRKNVLDKQNAENHRTIIADSNLFLYADKGNSRKFLRYSYDGIFPTTGEYCNDEYDPLRWEKIKTVLNIELQPWKTEKGRHILICCQRDGGWSMQGTSVTQWLIKVIQKIREQTDRIIMIRFHPGDKNTKIHKLALVRQGLHTANIKFSKSVDIREDFAKAYCVINHNSSPGVVAAIEGIPVFLTDPENSQAKDVAHHGIDQALQQHLG